jgi:hypothetical protein
MLLDQQAYRRAVSLSKEAMRESGKRQLQLFSRKTFLVIALKSGSGSLLVMQVLQSYELVSGNRSWRG